METVKWTHQKAKQGDVETIAALRQDAEEGNADAQWRLGMCYSKGHGVFVNADEAVKWFRKAAEQGHKDAATQLRETEGVDETVKKDFREFCDYAVKNENVRLFIQARMKKAWTMAAQKGIPEGQTFLGLWNFYCKDFCEWRAKEWFQKAAKQGIIEAQYRLGVCYANDERTPDHAKAVKWYRKAAEQGHAEGQVALGMACYFGRGIAKDEAEAIRWLRKAEEQGHYLVAELLQNIADWAELVKKHSEAAKLGDSEAQIGLAECYYNGWGVSKDDTEAANWWCKSAEQGNVAAQYRLGYCYLHGEGVSQDEAKAVEWWQKAAAQGHAEARDCCDWHWKPNEDCPQDEAGAMAWLRKSAEQGDVNAQARFGVQLYYAATCEDPRRIKECEDSWAKEGRWHTGQSCYHCPASKKGKIEALKWVTKAAEQGNAVALHQLSIFAFTPEGAEIVREWLDKAIERENKHAIDLRDFYGERVRQ